MVWARRSGERRRIRSCSRSQLRANAPQQADHRHLRDIAIQQMQAEEQRKGVITGIGDREALAWQPSLEKGEAAEFWPGFRRIDTLLAVEIEQPLQLHLEVMARLAARSLPSGPLLARWPIRFGPE